MIDKLYDDLTVAGIKTIRITNNAILKLWNVKNGMWQQQAPVAPLFQMGRGGTSMSTDKLPRGLRNIINIRNNGSKDQVAGQ